MIATEQIPEALTHTTKFNRRKKSRNKFYSKTHGKRFLCNRLDYYIKISFYA